MVFAGILKLFDLLLDLAVNFLTDLSKLKLSSEDLVLLLLKSSFSFFQSSLEFFLLDFKSATLIVELMDGAATISQLVKKILDLISQVLVFALHNIQLFGGF